MCKSSVTRSRYVYKGRHQHLYAKAYVIAQIALDLFENKENTRSVLLHSSTTGFSYGHMFDAGIGQIKGDLSNY